MESAAANIAMRPFGDVADLHLDFGQADRPGLITALLARCGDNSDPEFWWSQPVGLRTAALLRLLVATDPSAARLPLAARCVRQECGELYEFDLPLAALLEQAPETGPVGTQLEDGRTVTLRRPTGSDLRRWRQAPPRPRAEALRVMLSELRLEGALHEGDESALSRSLAEHDPVVGFSVLCPCPACSEPHEVAVDLEGVALARLHARQRMLTEEIHVLASRYGWSEAEVLAVPPQRRARYLSLIEAEA
jgi:hypothetical protein